MKRKCWDRPHLSSSLVRSKIWFNLPRCIFNCHRVIILEKAAYKYLKQAAQYSISLQTSYDVRIKKAKRVTWTSFLTRHLTLKTVIVTLNQKGKSNIQVLRIWAMVLIWMTKPFTTISYLQELDSQVVTMKSKSFKQTSIKQTNQTIKNPWTKMKWIRHYFSQSKNAFLRQRVISVTSKKAPWKTKHNSSRHLHHPASKRHNHSNK